MVKIELKTGEVYDITENDVNVIREAIHEGKQKVIFYTTDNLRAEINPQTDISGFVVHYNERSPRIEEPLTHKNDFTVYPPIGILPEKWHIRNRFIELRDAITRYISQDYQINPIWVEEYNRIIEEYPNIKEGDIYDQSGSFKTLKKMPA